jgi:hypothetical protein
MIKTPYILWRGRFSPLTEVEITHKKNSIRTIAFVDTGATYSVFHWDFGEELKIDIEKGDKIDLTVGDGGIIPVYLHDLKIKIDSLEFKGRVGFSDRLGTGINIIGRDGVLDKFNVCFDGPNKQIIWNSN